MRLKSINAAWKELKEAKYLRVHGYPNGGRGWRYEFELLDEPCEWPHTIYYDANGNPSKTNETANRGKNRMAIDEESLKNGDSSQYVVRENRIPIDCLLKI